MQICQPLTDLNSNLSGGDRFVFVEDSDGEDDNDGDDDEDDDDDGEEGDADDDDDFRRRSILVLNPLLGSNVGF